MREANLINKVGLVTFRIILNYKGWGSTIMWPMLAGSAGVQLKNLGQYVLCRHSLSVLM